MTSVAGRAILANMENATLYIAFVAFLMGACAGVLGMRDALKQAEIAVRQLQSENYALAPYRAFYEGYGHRKAGLGANIDPRSTNPDEISWYMDGYNEGARA